MYLIGLLVVRMMNGIVSLWVWLLMFIWFLVIVFNSVVCVFGGVWLILLVSNRLVKIGLVWNLK